MNRNIQEIICYFYIMKQQQLNIIRTFNDNLFGPLEEHESFHPDYQHNSFSGYELIIGINKEFVNYELSADGEVMDTELENLSTNDLQEIIRILEERNKS